jgi:chromate transporter
MKSHGDDAASTSSPHEPVTLKDIFGIFLMAGLTFGGGLAIVTVLERELVKDRRAITREEFLTYYAMARVVPTGTQTALAIVLGHHFVGLRGAVVAALGLLTPVFIATLGLTALFVTIQSPEIVDALPDTVLPAALALIAVGVISLSRDIIGFNKETALALAGFLAAWVLGMQPGVVLLLGGLVGIALFGRGDQGGR